MVNTFYQFHQINLHIRSWVLFGSTIQVMGPHSQPPPACRKWPTERSVTIRPTDGPAQRIHLSSSLSVSVFSPSPNLRLPPPPPPPSERGRRRWHWSFWTRRDGTRAASATWRRSGRPSRSTRPSSASSRSSASRSRKSASAPSSANSKNKPALSRLCSSSLLLIHRNWIFLSFFFPPFWLLLLF